MEESPQPPKNFVQGFVGEDIILPQIMPLCREMGERETRETFLEESFPNPSKNLSAGYGSKDLSRGILPTAKLWWIFAEDSRVYKHPLFILGQNPPEFSPAGENSVPRQGRKLFNLKVTLTYRSNAPLNRTLTEREVFAFDLFQSLGQALRVRPAPDPRGLFTER